MELQPGFRHYPISFTTKVRTYNLGDTQIPLDTVMLSFRGSVAHGMFVDPDDPNCIDDVDLIGITMPEPKYFFGLSEWGDRETKHYKVGIWDGVYYTARKMVGMLLKGNPNVMSLLWMREGDHIGTSPCIEPLIRHRDWFVSKHIYNAFVNYADQQLQKMETRDPAELRMYLALTAEAKYRGIHPNHKGECFPYPETWQLKGEAKNAAEMGDEILLRALRSFQKKGENIGYMGDKRKRLVLDVGYDSKNAAHCVRLLRMAIEFLKTGAPTVYRPDAGDDQELLSIKRGEWELQRVKDMAHNLAQEAEELVQRTVLPAEPETERAEALLVSMTKNWWDQQVW